MSTHPRTEKRLHLLGAAELPGFIFHPPFGYLDYNFLQLNAWCVVSDSGTISEESAIMGFRAVTLRDSMERFEAITASTISICPLGEPEGLITSIKLARESEVDKDLPQGYEQERFSETVLRYVLSTARQSAALLGLHDPRAT
jgi:UDP-N-acetylglucosamine 2-epimerase (non-hydrolysing)